jgi:hypothetical protein
MNMFRQLCSILPGAKPKSPAYGGPCAAESFVASRLKRQGQTAVPFPSRLAVERSEHPTDYAHTQQVELSTISPNAGL